MKFTAVSIAAFAGLAAAQQSGLGTLPECSKGCLNGFTSGSGQRIGDCAATDAKCICASKSFIDGIACCVADACSKEDQDASIKFASTFCGTLGVTVPSVVSCATKSASAGTPTATASGSGSSPVPTRTATPAGASPASAAGTASGAPGAVWAVFAAALAFL